MKKFYVMLIALCSFSISYAQPILTMISDGDCTGGNPKVLEIYANGTVDFSLYSLELSSNANTTWTNTTNLGTFGTVTDTYVYIYASGGTAAFQSEFPSITTDSLQVASVMNINGDDKLRIVLDGATPTVIDQFGETGVDGTGQIWEYKDGFAKRIPGTTADGTFNTANWNFHNDSLNGEGTCQGGTIPFEDLIGIGNFMSNDCSITSANLADLTCNDNGTAAITTDDYLTFSITPSANNNGANGYNLSVSAGTITPTSATSYGNLINCQLPNGSAGGGDVVLTITDVDSTSCSLDVTIVDPGACSSVTPDITATPDTLLNFDHIVGTPSIAQTFSVEGISLSTDITVAAPTGFEVSLDDVTYTSSVVLTQSTGTVAPTTVYARGNSADYGNFSGNIMVTSTGAINDTVYVSGFANDYTAYTIDEINGTDANGVADSLNVLVRLTGVVHCMDFRDGSGYNMIIVDGSGKGIYVYSSNDVSAYINPVAGDSIEIKGSIDQYQGLLQVRPDEINVLASVATNAAMSVTTLDENSENQYVTLDSVWIVTPIDSFPTFTTNIDITNGVETFTMRLQSASGLAGTPAPQGPFSVTGIGSQFDSSTPHDSGYQLWPCAIDIICAGTNLPNNAVNYVAGSDTIFAVNQTLNYQWIDCSTNQAIVGENNYFFTPNEGGVYAVVVSSATCSDTSICITFNDLSVEGFDFASGITVYPNPVKDQLIIDNANNETIFFTITDVNGKVIMEKNNLTKKQVVNTSSWNQGVYFIHVANEKQEKQVFKVIK